MNPLDKIKSLIQTPQPEIESMIEAHAASTKQKPADAEANLYKELLNKLGKVKVESGMLEVKYREPLAVEIHYPQEGRTNRITTISQIAITGHINTPEGTYNLTQTWVDRVFPQWKCRKPPKQK